MIRNLLIVFLLVTVLATSCTSTKKEYEENLETWLGKTENEMIMGWGIPDRQYQLDKRTKVVSYVDEERVIYPSSGFSTCFGVSGNNALLSNCRDNAPQRIQTNSCETIFVVTDGRISRWGHKGSNCRS